VATHDAVRLEHSVRRTSSVSGHARYNRLAEHRRHRQSEGQASYETPQLLHTNDSPRKSAETQHFLNLAPYGADPGNGPGSGPGSSSAHTRKLSIYANALPFVIKPYQRVIPALELSAIFPVHKPRERSPAAEASKHGNEHEGPTMFPETLNPFSRRSAGGYYYPQYRSPFLPGLFGGSLGFGLTIAGLMVIAHMVAPQLLEQMVPGWQQRFGLVVGIAVVLGFLRSILRLFVPIASLAFWAIAIYALGHASLPGATLLPSSLPTISASAPSVPSVQQSVTPIRLHGTPALPDSAYFPNRSSSSSPLQALTAGRSSSGLGALKRLFM